MFTEKTLHVFCEKTNLDKTEIVFRYTYSKLKMSCSYYFIGYDTFY